MISRVKMIWLLSYISIASVSSAIITPALPRIQIQFSLGLGEVEWVVSSFLLGYVFGQLIYGPLANSYGRLKALRIGLTINLTGLLLCLSAVWIGSYWFLVFGRFITALGAASGLACTYMLINEWLPEQQRKSALAYSILSFTLGVGLSVVIGGYITEYWHWSGCFIILLIQGLIMLFGIQVFDETLLEPVSINITSIFQGYKRVLSSCRLLIYSLILGICSSISYCYSAAGPQIADHLLQLTAADYGNWNLLNIAGMFAGGFLAKFLLDQFMPRQCIIISIFGCLLGFMNLALMLKTSGSSALWFFLSTANVFLFAGGLYGGGTFLASNAVEDKASSAAMMSFINMSVATFMVVMMGYLSANVLFSYLFVMLFLIIFAVTLIILDTFFCSGKTS